MAPRVTATAFSGIVKGAVPSALAAPKAAAAAPRVAAAGPKVAALTGELSRPHFGAAGVTWTGATPVGTTVEVRLREKGSWSGWQALAPSDEDGPDQGTAEARSAVHGTEPLLTDGADGVQVRVSSPSGAAPAGLKVQTVDPGTAPADSAPSSLVATPAAFVTPAATVGRGAPDDHHPGAVGGRRVPAPVCPRLPARHQGSGPAPHLSSNSYTAASAAAEIRSDYAYHTVSLGWCDLGYNFVVDRFGQIYEGRAGGVDRLVQGAHAIGFNGETFGVAALGDFQGAQPPAVMVSAIERLVAWKLGLSHIDPRALTTLTSTGNTSFAPGHTRPRTG